MRCFLSGKSADLCRRNPFKPVSGEASLLDVCKVLATGSHRVPVVDEAGNVINIISQSSVISYFLSSCVSQFSHPPHYPLLEIERED